MSLVRENAPGSFVAVSAPLSCGWGGDMKHASEAALDSIQPVLLELRQLEGVRERKPGLFYRKSSAFIHFHEDPAGIFADVSTGREWLRWPVNTASERRHLVGLVKEMLG